METTQKNLLWESTCAHRTADAIPGREAYVSGKACPDCEAFRCCGQLSSTSPASCLRPDNQMVNGGRRKRPRGLDHERQRGPTEQTIGKALVKITRCSPVCSQRSSHMHVHT